MEAAHASPSTFFGTPQSLIRKPSPRPVGIDTTHGPTVAYNPRGQAMKPGRQQSIPPEHWATVFRMYSEGHGYRRIADMLIPMHVCTTKSSVERLIKGLPPYQGRRVIPTSTAVEKTNKS